MAEAAEVAAAVGRREGWGGGSGEAAVGEEAQARTLTRLEIDRRTGGARRGRPSPLQRSDQPSVVHRSSQTVETSSLLLTQPRGNESSRA